MQEEDIIANNLDEFRRDIDRLRQAIALFGETFSEMTESLNNLNGMWEGGAHDALMERFARDTEFIETYIAYLEDYRNELEEANRSYTDCEVRVEDEIRTMLKEVGR